MPCPMPERQHYRMLSVQAAAAVNAWEGSTTLLLPDAVVLSDALHRTLDTAHLVAIEEAFESCAGPFLTVEQMASRRKHGWMFAPARLMLRKLDWYIRGGEQYVPTERDEIDRNLCRLIATGRMPDA